MASSNPKSPKLKSSSKRKHREEIESGPCDKKTKPNGAWRNLDLILSFESKNAKIQRGNIELAFNYVNSGLDVENQCPKNPVPTSRLASFMGSWVQHSMISSEDNSVDYKYWFVFEFCLKNSSVDVSPKILDAFTRALRKGIDNISEEYSDVVSRLEYFDVISRCLSLILSTNPRAFSNVDVDRWLSCTVEVAGALSRMYTVKSDEVGFSSVGALQRISDLLLNYFVSFLRFRPNPKNIFKDFVDRLLEPLLELLVLLHDRSNGGNCREARGFLERIEEVLSNGLFHPAHISGFFSFKALSSKKEARGPKSSKESYHKHFFDKLRLFILEKKGKALEGFGYLFQLFVNNATPQSGVPLAAKSEQRSSRNGNQVSGENQETNKPLIDVFVLFMRPLLLDGAAKTLFGELGNELGQLSEDSLKAAHCMLKSVNEIFARFIKEKIYVRTEDTSEGAHFTFLKEAYDAVISISDKMYLPWLSAPHVGNDWVRKILPMIAKEVTSAMINFLEIEYKIVENDLVNLWLMMFSYTAVFTSLEKAAHFPVLASEISRLGCRLINIYSELRQVNSPLFALCKAVRLLGSVGDVIAASYLKFNSFPDLSSDIYIRPIASWLCSHELQLVISDAIKSIPEGQASGCIQELKTDIIESLEWIKDNQKCQTETDNLLTHLAVLDMRAEVLGKVFTELYTTVLNSLTITATNSILIGNSIKDMMTTIGLSLSDLVQSESGNVEDFIFSVTGRRLHNHVTSESDNVKWNSLSSTSWILVFFFHMYASCRSLYRQTISLMPPKLSRKASESMGSYFVVASGVDWKEKPESMDEGYFSWIVKPSMSLPTVINFLSFSPTVCAPLVYVVHVIALQRLTDLNRLISGFEFLQGRGKQKSSKRWKKQITVFRQEAAELTNFIAGHIKLSIYEGFYMGSKNEEAFESNPVYDNSWDLGLCSLNEESLNIALWRLICQNIDIWCAHANSKLLKNFLSCIFLFSVPSGITSRADTEPSKEENICQKVTMHHISLEFLTSIVSYEQTILLEHFTSRFCRVLKKLLHPILSCASNIDMGSLPDWSEFMEILEKGSSSGMDYTIDSPGSLLSQPEMVDLKMHYLEYNRKRTSTLFSLEACESLVNLLCRMPQVHVNCNTFSIYATYLLNLERLVLSSLLDNHNESVTINTYELLRLFISCRRAMKFLVRASFQESSGSEVSPVSALFGCSTSILWLLRSVHAICGLPHTLYCGQVQDLIFSLVDHTSSILLAISEGKINFIKLSRKHALVEADSDANSSECTDSENYILLIADVLEEETRKLLLSVKESIQAGKLEHHFKALGCSKLSCMISFFQGFILGLIPGLDSMCKEQTTYNLHCSHLSKLSKCIAVFGDLINLCVQLLILDDKKEPETHDIARSSEELLNLHHIPETEKRAGKQVAGSDCQTHKHNDNSENSSRFGYSKSSKLKKQKVTSVHADTGRNFINAVNNVDLSKFQKLTGSLVLMLLKDEAPQIAFTIRQLFTAAGIFLRLNDVKSFPRPIESEVHNSQLDSSSMVVLLGTSQLLLRKMSEKDVNLNKFAFLWVDGVLSFLEVAGSMLSVHISNISKDAYAQLVHTHLAALGKCISLQGKEATLSSHEFGSNTKMLGYQQCSSRNDRSLDVNNFKTKLRLSVRNLVTTSSKLLLKTALKSIEKVLVGFQHGCSVLNEIETGNSDGGEVSSTVAAGVDCLDLVVESASGFGAGYKNVDGKKILSFVGSLFNIVLHIRSPKMFYLEKLFRYKSEAKPDPGSVVLMCVEVLTKIAGNQSFPMDPCHVSQCLQLPLALFEDFCKLRGSLDQKTVSSENVHNIVDAQYSIELYASCCRLLCSTIKHRSSETERCIAILEDSLSTLLNCLEMVDAGLFGSKCHYAWEIEEATKCGSFFRRIYEELRQQKDVFEMYAIYFLSTYISTYSGYGPMKSGINKEIDEALRPGVYSLIDMCPDTDRQQLHTLLGEGPRRNTLKTLLNDYKLVKYTGKI